VIRILTNRSLLSYPHSTQNDLAIPISTVTKLQPFGISTGEHLIYPLHGQYVMSTILMVMEIRTTIFRCMATDYMASTGLWSWYTKPPTQTP
jgi:hypothetical protein